MKKRLIAYLAIMAVVYALPACLAADTYGPVDPDDYDVAVRVACVGDSITFGAGIKDRAKNSYPAQLGAMLGEEWEVSNFGVNGATMLKKGDKPYWKQRAFDSALESRPHVVIIKLGTNDTKPQNWKHKAEMASNYKEMIDRFAALETHPKIWICYPVPAFPARWGIRDSIIKDELIPIIADIAEDKDVPVIDLYKPFVGKADLFPDKIHPNAKGAGMMAEMIAEVIAGLPVGAQ